MWDLYVYWRCAVCSSPPALGSNRVLVLAACCFMAPVRNGLKAPSWQLAAIDMLCTSRVGCLDC